MMTTQTNVNRSNETIQKPVQISHQIMRFVIVALLVSAVITTAYMVISPGERVIDTINRVMEAQTDRYQGLANAYFANENALERGWDASALRYQAMADFYAFSKLSPASKASAARYEGLAEYFEANGK